MSVVGLTFGNAAKATRPMAASAASAATSATTRAGGRERSYQPKPIASATASTSAEPSCRSSHQLRREHRGALIRRQCLGLLAEHPRGVGGELPAAREHLVRRRI